MTERWIDKDEWYPVYTLNAQGHYLAAPVEVSDEDHADYERVMAEFAAWQVRLSEVVDAARAKPVA